MRIDKFLKNSRLIKRRTVAKEACEQERILIHIRFGSSSVTARVIKLLDSSRKEDAADMYEIIE